MTVANLAHHIRVILVGWGINQHMVLDLMLHNLYF
jgi:hypothetical protein